MLIFNGLENIGLLALRIFIGIIFLYHGYPKIRGGKQMAAQMGKPQMGWFFIFLGIAESLGGLATILGLLTEIAALGFIIVMLGAIYMKMKKWNIPFFSQQSTGWEFDFMLLGVALALLLLGAGQLSLDSLFGFWP